VFYIQQHLSDGNIKQQKNYQGGRSLKETKPEQVPTHLIKYLVLSDNSHRFSPRPFLMTTASTVLASILVCRESGSMSLLYKCTGVNIKFLKKMLGKIAFGPQTFVISKEVYSLLYIKIL
jgi:hypothetical protein